MSSHIYTAYAPLTVTSLTSISVDDKFLIVPQFQHNSNRNQSIVG